MIFDCVLGHRWTAKKLLILDLLQASLDASHQPLSMVDEEDEDKMEEEMDEEEEAEEAPPAAGDTFQVYVSSYLLINLIHIIKI